MNIPRKHRVSLRAATLGLLFAVAACSGAEDTGLTGGNTEPDGGSASGGGSGSGGTSAGGAGASGGGSAGTDTGGAGASGAGSSGTGGVLGPEDCLNGRDDDGDGDEDCADDECVAVECVAEAPDGWSGPVAFRDVDAADTDRLVCPDGFPSIAFDVGGELSVGGDATCRDCACEATADQCQAFAWMTERGCRTTPVEVVTEPIECVPVDELVTGGFNSFVNQLGFGAEYTGNCSVSQAQPELPTAAWGRRALGCAAPTLGGGCVERATCAPRIDAGSRVCIFREGDRACTDHYPSRFLRYRELKDQRCEICCDGFEYPGDSIFGSYCRVDMDRYDDPSCDRPSAPGPNNSVDCGTHRPSTSFYTATGSAPERASCRSGPVSNDPVKPVAGEGPLTICCVE